MTFTIKGSHILAAAIVLAIGLWMFGGELRIGGQNDTANATQGSTETVETDKAVAESKFKVEVVEIQTTDREQTVNLRGRTKADAVIPIRTETTGILEKRMVKRGDTVTSGDLVCVINQGARKAGVASAYARLQQALGEYESNKKLKQKGFATDTKLRQMQYDLNAAQAELEQAQLELARTEVRANANGVVQDPIAEVGDVLIAGNTCITLVDADPMFFIGQVSERAINDVTVGMDVDVKLVTGEIVTGKVNYLATSAEPQTRTFRVEVKLDDNDINIRDGLTASAALKLPVRPSIKVSPSWLTLADNGQIGVKSVNADNRVEFLPVTILSQSKQGFWISGIEAGTRIITLGQEYVIAGETVEPVMATIEKAALEQ